MSEAALVTDDDLARARVDPAFRHQLVADNLASGDPRITRARELATEAQRHA